MLQNHIKNIRVSIEAILSFILIYWSRYHQIISLNTSLDYPKRIAIFFSYDKSLFFWHYFDVLFSWFETLSKDDDTNKFTELKDYNFKIQYTLNAFA